MTNEFYRRNTKAAKLSWSQIGDIRREYEAGATQGELCKKYGMSVGQIGRIVRGESWKDIKGGDYKPLVGPMDFEASAARVLKRVQEENEREEMEKLLRAPKMEVDPEVQRRADMLLGRIPMEETRRAEPPPDLLDGGDAPPETDGSALNRLGEALQTSPGVIIAELKNESKQGEEK